VRAARVVAVSLGTAVTRLRMADALTRSEARLRAVIDTAMDAVVSMDGRGEVIGWNAQAEAIFGWTAAEALGRRLHELIIPEELRESHQLGLSRFLDTGEGTMLGRRQEVPALRKDGTRLTVELALTRVHTPDEDVFSGFLRDITEQKRAAEELVQARAAAEAANRAKSEFLANMSHEIRTPLTAILGYTELLRDDGDLGRAPEQRIATIDTIQGAGQHLLTIINDILDISKIEAGKMTVESVETPLVGLLQEIQSLLRPRAAEKGVELTTRLASALPEHILSDPTRLRQILMNLAGNAVKFTDEGAITILAREETRRGTQRLLIDVEDTGPGMTPAQVARLFTSFGQADASVTRRHGGSGLGLTISHRLAQLLGGSVSLVRTEPGEGSCFRLELPLVPAPGAALVERLGATVGRSRARPPASQRSAPVLAGRVLLAEDGRDNQTIIAFHMRKAGAELDVASNGRIALEMLERAATEGRPYDLLLTDIQMPEMDGYTLARALRDCGNRIPIVALTAHAMAEDRKRCLDAGCDDYAVKPIDKTKLLATCAKWIAKRPGADAA
jgi:PAS domain S-box-containing protein